MRKASGNVSCRPFQTILHSDTLQTASPLPGRVRGVQPSPNAVPPDIAFYGSCSLLTYTLQRLHSLPLLLWCRESSVMLAEPAAPALCLGALLLCCRTAAAAGCATSAPVGCNCGRLCLYFTGASYSTPGCCAAGRLAAAWHACALHGLHSCCPPERCLCWQLRRCVPASSRLLSPPLVLSCRTLCLTAP